MTPDPHAQTVADAVRGTGTGLLFVITGAGISAASGIPTFRGNDPDAVWKHDLTEMATRTFFQEDPVESWRWYMSRFDGLEDARPNAAHQALVDLQAWHEGRGGSFLLVTQNIDTLHEQAGSRDFVKVHGSSDRVRCWRDGCRMAAPQGSLARADFDLASFRAAPSEALLPRCPECGGIVRPHVLWFDEYYGDHVDYGFERVQSGTRNMSCALVIGTSLSVGVTAAVLQAAALRGVPALHIEPSMAAEAPWLTRVSANAEDVLPAAMALLRG